MANNYSSLTNEKKSKKFILARFNPARYISDDLSFVSGTTYTATLIFETVNKIKVNGLFLTKVSSTPAANQFFYDEATKILLVNLGGLLTTQRIIAYHYLFFSSLDSVFAQEEPKLLTGENRLWRNRVSNDPSLGVDLSNVVQGYIKTSNINLDLINNDNFIDQYLTNNDSFSKKEIKIWHCINSIDNIANFYTGNITSLTVADNVSISTDNAFTFLETLAYKDGLIDGDIYDNTSFTNVIPKDIGKTVKQQYCRTSPYIEINNNDIIANERYECSNADLADWNGFPLETFQGTNTNYNSTSSTTTNREWTICYSDASSGDDSQTITSVSTPTAFHYTIGVADSSMYLPSDEVFINSISVATNFVVAEIFSATSISIFSGNVGITAPIPTDTLIRKEISVLYIRDKQVDDTSPSTPFYLRLVQGTDYNVSNASGYCKVTLVNNFEANFVAYSGIALSPDVDLFVRRWKKTNLLNHGSVVQELLENVGLTVNGASITAANLTTKELSFTIPYVATSRMKRTRDYLQDIMMSVGGYLSINSDNEVVYELIDSPSSGDEKTDNEILDNSFKKVIDYKDIKNQLEYNNSHGYSVVDENGVTLSTISVSTSADLLSQELNDVNITDSFQHVLFDATTFGDNYLDLRKYRKQLKTYGSKVDQIAKVGDDITYSFGNEADNNTIIKVNKNSKGSIITTTDFLGV